MIDIESKIFTIIANAVKKSFPKAYVSGSYVNRPARFPHVSIIEKDNYDPSEMLDSRDTQRFADVVYEINVYSNKKGTAKSECREIMDAIGDVMYRMNFLRMSMSPVPNLENATIYRLVARYRARTDGSRIYRR